MFALRTGEFVSHRLSCFGESLIFGKNLETKTVEMLGAHRFQVSTHLRLGCWHLGDSISAKIPALKNDGVWLGPQTPCPSKKKMF
jgi:hypothetical protein